MANHRWGPWDIIEVGSEEVTWAKRLYRECEDCGKHEFATPRTLCDIR